MRILSSDIKAYNELLQKMVEETKNKNKSDFLLNMLDKEIAKLNNEKVKKEEAKSNVNNVIVVFKDIFNNYSKENYLQSFIDENKNDIFEIFNLIQSPKEFAEIEYIKDKGLILQREKGGKAKLQEISSGQRSALAISIFLTLNKQLKNGPKYLIFDDPIAFTDDLNVLSFFDYLREYMIKSDRQLFFSTANDDLAFLFKKKFDFLGDDFRIISLDR